MPRLAPLAPLLLLLAGACATVSAPAPAPAPPAVAPAPPLPPVPLVEGPLAPTVVYPPANSLISAGDSGFIFGSVGNGHAHLSIDGQPVPVLPNGSWIAWLPLPGGDQPHYDLLATLGADSARLVVPVRRPSPRLALPADGPLLVDSGTAVPRGGSLALRDDEPVRVALRAPANATVWLRTDSATRIMLMHTSADSQQWVVEVAARQLRAQPMLVAARGADTVRLPVGPVAAVLPHAVSLGSDSAALDTDAVLIARPTATPSPNAAYVWFLLPGTLARLTGRSGDLDRIRLDDNLEAWVPGAEVHDLPTGTPTPRRIVGQVRIRPAADWVDVVFPIDSRPPFLVAERPRRLILTLYGTHGNIDVVNYGGNDSLIRAITWEQVATDRARFTLDLATEPYGYLALWESGHFVLRVRRPPVVDAAAPLRGLRIAIDPGHPPIGATGPTGLWEPVATLAVGQRVRSLLEARGATVIMTRTTPDPVALGDRPIIARRAGAHALVSIHLNALPDGMNPFTSALGSGAYYFHPQSIPLARALENAMLARMGLANYGINFDNLALARPTWMPAVLCEGAFIIMPEQEAALRTPEFQERYAQAIVDGLEAYFRTLAERR